MKYIFFLFPIFLQAQCLIPTHSYRLICADEVRYADSISSGSRLYISSRNAFVTSPRSVFSLVNGYGQHFIQITNSANSQKVAINRAWINRIDSTSGNKALIYIKDISVTFTTTESYTAVKDSAIACFIRSVASGLATLSDGDYGDVVVSGGGLVMTVDKPDLGLHNLTSGDFSVVADSTALSLTNTRQITLQTKNIDGWISRYLQTNNSLTLRTNNTTKTSRIFVDTTGANFQFVNGSNNASLRIGDSVAVRFNTSGSVGQVLTVTSIDGDGRLVINPKTGGSGTANCEQTLTKTAHGFRKWTPIYWNGSAWARPTFDSIIPTYIVVDSTSANTFKVSNCGNYSSTLTAGLYYYKGASPGYSLTPTSIPTPLFEVAQSRLILQPLVGFNLAGGSGAGDVTSAVLADTAAAIRADFPSGTTLSIIPDTFGLPEIKEFVPAVGIAANESVANYTPSSIDANRYKLSTTRFGSSGSTEYGGWLANGTSGDSVSVTAPFGVVIGDSQAEGHGGLHGRLHPRTNTFQATYPDSMGQLSYHLRQLTKMRWYNQGIGGQTSRQTRARFYRDAIGVNSNPNDGLGSVATIPGKPYIVTIVTGINDVFAGYTNDEVIENLRWMAATCNENGIKCVVLNLPGDEIITQAQARAIEVVNKFLNEGGLDPYNAVVVDYNKWWKDPSYNSLNVGNSLIADDIHPSKVGYDSLANYISREANLPVLSKLVISTERDPAGFSGFSRANSVNLNGVTYAVADVDIDTLEIANVLKDTVWIKINASTNVTGTSYSGFSHLQWYFTNNPQNRQYYTKRRYYGASVQKLSSTGLTLKPTGFEAQNILDIRYADNNPAMRVNVSGGLGVDFGSGSTFLASEPVRVHGSLGVATYFRSYQDARIGNLEINRSGFAVGTGAGITAAIEALRFDFGDGDLEFRKYTGNTGTRTWTSTNPNHVTWRSGFAGSLNANGRTAVYHYEIPIYNVTFGGGVTNAKVWYRYYNPTITSLPAGIQHIYLENVSGDNLFNTTSGNTGVGVSTTTARLHLGAGTATTGTAPLKFTSGTNLTTAEAGAIEYDGTEFYATNSTASRTTLARVLKGSNTLDFSSTAAGAVTDLTITVTGAADGDVVSLSVPNASQTTTGSFSAWVSATNTVTVRYRIAALVGAEDPASGTFKVTVTK